MKKLLYLSIGILAVWAIAFSYNRLTDGFSIRQMASSTPFEETFSKGCGQIESLMNQPYYYLGKGCQFYAFESADGQYVIKFLKQKHLRLPLFWTHVPMPIFLREQLNEKIAARKERIRNLIKSCRIAMDEMPDETGLMYIHFDRTPVHAKLTLIDKIGLKHQIDPSAFEFIVQKKACTLEESLATLIQRGELENIKKIIDQLCQLVYSRCKKGIRDRDRSFAQNVGFTLQGGQAVFTDVGQFFKDETVCSDDETRKDIARRLGNLRFWCQEKHPELLPYFDATCSVE